MSRVRRILRRVVAASVEAGQRIGSTQIAEIMEQEWPSDHQADHPHIQLYRPRAHRWAEQMGNAIDLPKLRGAAFCEGQFEFHDSHGVSRTLRFNLVGHLRDSSGDRVVLVLETRGSHADALNWSDLKDYERMPFVLLHERHGRVLPLVFTGSDGAIRPFKWKRGKSAQAIADEASSARQTFERLVSGAFDGTVDDWTCDRCACRILCPWWMGAVS